MAIRRMGETARIERLVERLGRQETGRKDVDRRVKS